MPVNGLASGEKGLDANMQKALKGDRYKDIRFRMESYEVAAPVVGATTFKVVLHGRLSLAGSSGTSTSTPWARAREPVSGSRAAKTS